MDTEHTQDPEHIHGDEGMSLHPLDDSTIDHDVLTDCERPKLYNKALFLLKLKEEQRLSQVAINSLIGDYWKNKHHKKGCHPVYAGGACIS